MAGVTCSGYRVDCAYVRVVRYPDGGELAAVERANREHAHLAGRADRRQARAPQLAPWAETVLTSR
jgi:hypothetical protein